MRKTITAVAIGIAVLLGACDRASDAARNYYSEVKSEIGRASCRERVSSPV